MKFPFAKITAYYKKGERLVLIPKGELQQFSVDIDIEPAIVIELPTTLDDLKQEIEKSFKLCWTASKETLTKGPSIIEKVMGYKSYKKVVENLDSFSLTYNKIEKKYTITQGLKAKNFRYYEGIDFQFTWNKIDYDFIYKLIN